MNDIYRQQIESLRRALNLAQGKVSDLKAHLDIATRAYDQLLADMDALRAERDAMRAELDEIAARQRAELDEIKENHETEGWTK